MNSIRPDFACTDITRMADRDLQFLIENFPEPGRSYEEIASVIHRLPTTLESMLDSQFVFDKIMRDRTRYIRISPFLFFNVLLRHILSSRRTPIERSTINYLANLLTIFIRTDRVYRIQPHDRQTYEYLMDAIKETTEVDTKRQFLIAAHIGNYSLYLSGLFSKWLDHRHRFKRRPVDARYYAELGRTYYHRAATYPLANEYGLSDVFLHLALMFDHYRKVFNQLADRYLTAD